MLPTTHAGAPTPKATLISSASAYVVSPRPAGAVRGKTTTTLSTHGLREDVTLAARGPRAGEGALYLSHAVEVEPAVEAQCEERLE